MLFRRLLFGVLLVASAAITPSSHFPTLPLKAGRVSQRATTVFVLTAHQKGRLRLPGLPVMLYGVKTTMLTRPSTVAALSDGNLR